MSVKNFQRITFSLPKSTVLKLAIHVPKNKRSKFVAKLIESDLKTKGMPTWEEFHQYWENFREKYPRKTKKTAVELVREDRASH